MSDFFLDPWLIQPSLNQIRRGEEVRRLGSKVMDLLVCLAEHPDRPVTKEELIARVWQGEFTTEESLTTAVYELRKALDDDARCPKFIGTVRGRGYRLLGKVDASSSAGVTGSATEAESPAEPEDAPTSAGRATLALAQQAPTFDPVAGPEHASGPRQLPRAAVIVAVMALLSFSAWLLLRRSPPPDSPTEPNGTAASVGAPVKGADPAPIPPGLIAEPTTSGASTPDTAINPYASGPRAVCSVVVVPIESLTADPNSSVFAQGLSEQLAQDLAQSGTLAVVPGYSSVMSGRLSSDLSTDAVVEGSVQASGTRLWIRMQMVDTLGGRLLWGGTYAHELGNSLDLQQELSKEITLQILEQIEPVADCAAPSFDRPSPQGPG